MMNVYCCHYLSQIILLLDIDECADFTDECRPNGNCTNTIPHYYCTCNARYKAVANEMQCEGKQISNNFLSHFNPYSVNRSKKWIQQILTNWFLEDLEIGERVNKLKTTFWIHLCKALPRLKDRRIVIKFCRVFLSSLKNTAYLKRQICSHIYRSGKKNWHQQKQSKCFSFF